MPYCPKCREEFQDWVTTCPDCGVSLVDILPEPPVPELGPKEEPSKEPLVHVATVPSEQEAMMWAGVLEEEGIHSLVKGRDWYMRAAIPFYPSNHEIHVVASQAEKAKKILDPLIGDSESTA
jgi:hypothetical protein